MIEWVRSLASSRAHAPMLALSRYREGDLPSKRRVGLEAHLRRCPRCAGELRALSEMLEALRSLRVESDRGLADSIVAAFRAESPRGALAVSRPPRVGSARLTIVPGAAGPSASHRRWRVSVPPRSGRASLRALLVRSRLRVTVPIALLVGAALSLINQSAMIFSGRVTVGMCLVCGANFVAPFIALNVGLLMAMRWPRRRRF
jgi:hypothetical protein